MMMVARDWKDFSRPLEDDEGEVEAFLIGKFRLVADAESKKLRFQFKDLEVSTHWGSLYLGNTTNMPFIKVTA